jgi:hypothetical protein
VHLWLPIERVLWGFSLLVQTLLVFRLAREGLIRRYPFFAAYLIVETASALALLPLPARSPIYTEAFRWAGAAFLLLRAAVACELWERICEHFPGIGREKLVLAAFFLAFGVVAAVFSWRPDLSQQWGFPQTYVVIALEIEGEIYPLVFLLLWLFINYILSNQQPFRPNVRWHWVLSMIYFATSGIASFLVLATGGGSKVFPINCGMLAADIACLGTWLAVLRRSGEMVPYYRRMSAEEIEEVKARNRDLNEFLKLLSRDVSGRARAR